MANIAINPNILAWARTTAGLSLHEGARKIGLNSAYGQTGEERLAALESGETEPSRATLVKMAKAYRRPLLVFYLPEPPAAGDRGQDFRTLPGAAPLDFSPLLDALLRDLRARQSIVRSLQDDVEAEPIGFIGSVTMGVPVAQLAERVAAGIGFSRAAFQSQKTIDAAFAYLRGQIERAGVFVLLLGNLGSHHSNIPADVFRGFAISDPLAPFVVINDQDARAAWAFTALHELVHLWLGTTGVSGASAGAQIERYCNEVASEILLPAAEVARLRGLKDAPLERVIDAITGFADSFKVSRDMVGYRVFRAGLVSQETWQAVRGRFREEWLASRASRAAKQKHSEGGPNFYVVRRHKLGVSLLALVGSSLSEGSITYTKAGQVLGVKPRNVDPLLQGTVGTI